MSQPKWSTEFPTEPGLYWFYGYRYGRINCGQAEKPELHFVEFWGSGLAVTKGQIMYKSEIEDAHFMPAQIPALPEIEPVDLICQCDHYHFWEGDADACPECGSTEVKITFST